MEEILTGIGAFGILVLFEYQKCRNVRQNKKGRNPWFLLGMLLLIGAFVMEAVKDEASQGWRFTQQCWALRLANRDIQRI